MLFGSKPWTKNQLADDLRAAGFHDGQNIILHSSLRSIGKTENGPDTVIDAILSVIGPAGNLLVPTFTYSLPGWKGDPFDIKASPARTGAIPNCLRLRPGAIRSFHPTHSAAVLGPDAAEITRNHMNATPLGTESPFARMLEHNATILMIGTHQDTNSSLHLCEVMAKLPYLEICFSANVNFEMAWFQNSDGEIEFAQIHEVPGCSRGFRAIEPELTRRGILRSIRIGNANCQMLNLRQLTEAAMEILCRNPTLLLCHLEHCGICPKRRAFMKKN